MTHRSSSMNNQCVVFDLDDTLYKEVEFVKSGFHTVAKHFGNEGAELDMLEQWRQGHNAFKWLIQSHCLSADIQDLLYIYRSHIPLINLDKSSIYVLEHIKNSGGKIGIITDGRSITQRNKIKALGLYRWIHYDDVVISEEFGSAKPDKANYEYFMSKYPGMKYLYIGDNPEKDFVAPNLLGWDSICLRDNGQNIHCQNFDKKTHFLPAKIVDNISKIII